MKTISIVVILLLTNACEKKFSNIYSYEPPEFADDGIQVGTLEEVELDSQMLTKVMGRIYTNKYDQVHSFLIYKDGLLVFEEYMEGNKYKYDGPYHYGERIQWGRDSLHIIHSVTKSITSACIGIAIDKGYISSENESIFNYLPEHQEFKSGGREDVTIEHLLTMTSGLKWDEWGTGHGSAANDIDRIYWECQDDPLACVLENPMTHSPGEKFNYNGGGTDILGEILKNASGMNIRDFSEEYLFGLLEIDSVYWTQFENGVFSCDGHFKMTPRGMLKIGITFLNEGIWNDQRIISKEWVEKSKTTYGNNRGINIPIDDSGRNGYAFSWWTNQISGAGMQASLFQAGGWGGQEIIVIPDLNMVVVFTGGNYVVKKHYYQILERFVLPAITG